MTDLSNLAGNPDWYPELDALIENCTRDLMVAYPRAEALRMVRDVFAGLTAADIAGAYQRWRRARMGEGSRSSQRVGAGGGLQNRDTHQWMHEARAWRALCFDFERGDNEMTATELQRYDPPTDPEQYGHPADTYEAAYGHGHNDGYYAGLVEALFLASRGGLEAVSKALEDRTTK